MPASIIESFPVQKGEFVSAGDASTAIKRTLKQLGVSATVMRRVAVAAYEVELNIIIHSNGGVLKMEMDGEKVTLISRDTGPGIPDVDLAMQAGYSTASEEARALGFGAGMGLPNMKRNADEFHITSAMGEGTEIVMVFHLT